MYILHDTFKTSLRQGKVQGRCFFVWSKPWHSGQKVDKKPLYFQIGKIFDSFFLSSLLRHHPSAVSCDDSDLLLEESCVMDISTEVLYFPWIWLYDRWTILYEFLRMDMILRQCGCPLRGKGVTTSHLSWCESSDAFINICLKHLDIISIW